MIETPPPQTQNSGRRLPGWLLPALGYAVSIACLVWVYYGFDWKGQLPRLWATDWWWVSLAAIFDILVYVCQGWRWTVLLSPLAPVSMLRSTQAVYIGLFANEVLPLRSGEVIRCYLQRRWSGLPLSVVLSSAVIERLMDGVWLVLGFWVIGQFVELPGWLLKLSNGLVVGLVVVGALFAWAIVHRRHAHEVVRASRWALMLRHVVDGVYTMGRSSTFVYAALLSLLYLALQVMPIWCLMKGYGLDLSLGAATTVLVMLRIGTVIPQAPGNVGSFQYLVIRGLELFQVDREVATGFATLLFLVVTVPLYLGGFIALMATRMRLGDIHRSAHEAVASQREKQP